MEKKLVAKELVLGELNSLNLKISEGWIGATDFCNHSKNNKCKLNGFDCKYVDKICMSFEASELLDEIDKIVAAIKGMLSSPTIKNSEPKIMFEIEEKEMVDHPSHYNMGKYEAIDVIEDWELGFNLGNTIKYISRAGHKDNIVQDLKKAMWYLDREIQRLENKEK